MTMSVTESTRASIGFLMVSKRLLKRIVLISFLLSLWLVPQAVQGSGAYRLLNYTGTLTDNTLELETLPAGFSEVVTTAVSGQVNLVVSSSSVASQLWDGPNTVFDGTVHGGTGTWDNFTTNFTDAEVTVNQAWLGGTAIFAAEPGTVTLGDNIAFNGMQFTSDGYTIVGAGGFTLVPTGTVVISTDPGVSATISASITGSGGLDKAGPGSLAMSGNNTYTGGTTISAGVLSVGTDTNLGNPSGGITLVGGELLTTVDGFTTARTVDVNAGGSPDILAAANGTTATYTGVLSDTGVLVVGDGINGGTVILTGANTYSGGTNLNGGILAVSNDGNLGTGPLNFNGGTLEARTGGGGITSSKAITLFGNGGTFLADAGTRSTLSAAITGNGSFTLSGAGTLVLTGNNTYSGGTTISGGTLQIGDTGGSGSIAGDVVDNGTLAFNRSGILVFNGVISGAGIVAQIGPGGLALTAANSYNGGTSVTGNGAVIVNNDTALGAPAGGITLQGGELETDGNFMSARTISTLIPTAPGVNVIAAAPGTTSTFSGVISGGGGLVVGDTGMVGTVILSGVNTYTGGTTVSNGATLSVANDGNLGASSGGLTLNGGKLLATGNLLHTSRAITVNNGILAAAPGGSAEISGNIRVNGGLTIGDVVNNGVVAFSGANTYAGTTTIVSGATLRAGSTTGFSPNSAFTVDGTLDLRGIASQVGSLSGTGTVTNESGQLAVLTAGNDNSSRTFSGVIQNGGFPLALSKVGRNFGPGRD
jgi:fibronectin-binding autotransporter adhesin